MGSFAFFNIGNIIAFNIKPLFPVGLRTVVVCKQQALTVELFGKMGIVFQYLEQIDHWPLSKVVIHRSLDLVYIYPGPVLFCLSIAGTAFPL